MKIYTIIKILIFNITLCWTNFLNAQSVYYICDCQTGAEVNCISGNDLNNGTSPTSPWQSIPKVQSIINSLQPGDQILFAKGGAWADAYLSIHNFNSMANNPIVLNSYTPNWGGTSKPLLTESRSGFNLLNFEDGGNADHDEGYLISNLSLKGNGSGKWGVFAYNDADYIVLDNLSIDGFQIGIHSGNAQTPNSGADYENQYMSVLNTTVTNCSHQGFLGGGSGLLIENCYFENNGFGNAVFNHNIYLSKGNNVIIRNNELYKSAFINGQPQGVSLVVHGVHDNLLIEGNYIHEDSGSTNGNGWGIGVDAGYSSAEGFTNLIIRGNIIENMYNVGIGVNSCQGTIIENNIIIQDNSSGFTAISAPDVNNGPEDMDMDNLTIRNNTIFLRNANSNTIAIKLGDEGVNHVVVSNVISLDNGNAFLLNLPINNYLSVDYNLVEMITSNPFWGNNLDLTTWVSTTGFDNNSQSGNPNFTSSNIPYNLKPLSTSILINNGHPTLSSSMDINNVNRIIPDIGAFEYSTLTDIVENQKAEKIKIYPNPFVETLIIELPIEMDFQLSLFDIQGKQLFVNQYHSKRIELVIDELKSGLYLLFIENLYDNSKKSIKIFKR